MSLALATSHFQAYPARVSNVRGISRTLDARSYLIHLSLLSAGTSSTWAQSVCGIHLVLTAMGLRSTSPGSHPPPWTPHSMKALALATAEVLPNMTLPDLPKERRKETFVIICPGYMRHRATSSTSSCEVACNFLSAPKSLERGIG
jgi:hypothetical protein